MTNLKQINVKKLWEIMELSLSGKLGKDTKITIQQVVETSIVPLDYLLKNRKNSLWDNPIYLASVVEALYKIADEPMECMPIYWIEGKP